MPWLWHSLQDLTGFELATYRVIQTDLRNAPFERFAISDRGMTVSDYIWRARLLNCRQELETQGGKIKTITDVAFSWGFSSSSHFSRVFRNYFGIAPSSIHKAQNASHSISSDTPVPRPA